MESKTVEVVLIIDQSGSMDIIADDTVGSYNTFISQQKIDQEKDGLNRLVTLVFFSTRRILAYHSVPLTEIHPLPRESYRPNGGTALLDAIGETVAELGRRLDDTNEAELPKKVVMAIITDGQENSSTAYNKKQIKDMITNLTEMKGWDVFFLGANIDAFEVGRSLGVARANTMTWESTGQGVKNVFAVTSESVTRASRTAGNS